MIGYIYKIVNDIDNSFYIGSTWNKLNLRYNSHTSDCNNGSECKVHQKMRDIGINHCRIELIERVEVKDRKERLQIEQKYITELKPDLNVNKAFLTEEEHLEQGRKLAKKYYETHKEKKKKYYKDHIDHIKEYYGKHKTKTKEYQIKYREDHKDRLKEYQTKYRAEHKN